MQDIARWIVALTTLIGFGLTLGLNPALYGATADMLARNLRVAAKMSWMVAGLATGATILFVLLQTFDPTNLVTAIRGDVDTALLSRTVDLVAGAVFLLAAAAVAWWSWRIPTRSVAPLRAPKGAGRSWSYFPLGLSCSIVGFTTLPIMYMTGRVTASLSSHVAPRIAAYIVFLIALAAPFVLLAWVWGRFPTLSARITGYYARVMAWDYRWAFACLLAAAGLVFLGLGLFLQR